MCALDALGIPPMLGADAVITSADPLTSAPVTVTFSGQWASQHPEVTGSILDQASAEAFGAQTFGGAARRQCLTRPTPRRDIVHRRQRR